MKDRQDAVLTGNPVKVFFSYSIPTVIGFLAISSAETVDAIFVGNFAGAASLAAINLVMPFFYLIFGFGVMIITGSSVRCGKYIGEGDIEAASAMFTRAMIVLVLNCLFITIIGLVFPQQIVALLGANDELTRESALYLAYISGFTLFFLGAYALSVFVKIDGRPVLSSVGLISGAMANVVLDWWMVAELGMGVKGAAIATGASQGVSIIILATHFIGGKSQLRFNLHSGKWREVWQACYNGISELTNELSGGIVVLIFNWIMITRMGVSGVAAFTVIIYTLSFGMMISYGISDSLLPIISTNFGARQPDRIRSFFIIAAITVTGLGIILFSLISGIPEQMIGIFLKQGEIETTRIALEFSGFVKWVFLISGLSMILSAYFTAMHKPLESAAIALCRSLILPVLGLIILPPLFGDAGIFITIPLAELLSLIIASFLFLKNRPSKLVSLSTPVDNKNTAVLEN